MSLKVWLYSACDIEAVRPRHLFSLSHVQSAVLWSKRGFPGGTVLYVKNLPAIAGDTGDTSSIPGSGRSSRVGNGNPLQYSWKFHGQRSLVGYNPCSHKESHMTKHVRTHTHKHTHTHTQVLEFRHHDLILSLPSSQAWAYPLPESPWSSYHPYQIFAYFYVELFSWDEVSHLLQASWAITGHCMKNRTFSYLLRIVKV